MSVREQFARLRQQWRQTPRLRYGALAILAVLGIHATLWLADRRAAIDRDLAREAELLFKMKAAAHERAWPERMRQAEAQLQQMWASLPAARTEGAAQADLQAWLTRAARESALEAARVQVEPALDVPGHPELWQVVGRLDANVPPYHLPPFLRTVTFGLPWRRAETVEVTDAQPMRMTLVVRSFYRRGVDVDRTPDVRAARPGASPTPTTGFVTVRPTVFPAQGGPQLPPTGSVAMANSTADAPTGAAPLAGTLASAPVGASPAMGAASAPRARRASSGYRPPRLSTPGKPPRARVDWRNEERHGGRRNAEPARGDQR